MDGTGEDYAKQAKSGERQMQDDFTDMWTII